MYDELIKRLRCQLFGNCLACVNWYTEEVEPGLWRERCAAIDAADAIEELSRQLAEYHSCGDETPVTNADRIRAMTDEELAAFIGNCIGGAFWRVKVGIPSVTKNEWLDWLKQERDE